MAKLSLLAQRSRPPPVSPCPRVRGKETACCSMSLCDASNGHHTDVGTFSGSTHRPLNVSAGSSMPGGSRAAREATLCAQALANFNEKFRPNKFLVRHQSMPSIQVTPREGGSRPTTPRATTMANMKGLMKGSLKGLL